MSKARARPNVAYWTAVQQILRAWNDIVVGGMDVTRLDFYAGKVDGARKGGASVPQRLGSAAEGLQFEFPCSTLVVVGECEAKRIAAEKGNSMGDAAVEVR